MTTSRRGAGKEKVAGMRYHRGPGGSGDDERPPQARKTLKNAVSEKARKWLEKNP